MFPMDERESKRHTFTQRMLVTYYKIIIKLQLTYEIFTLSLSLPRCLTVIPPLLPAQGGQKSRNMYQITKKNVY